MSNGVNLRNLGRTDIRISPIGLGCWQFSKQSNFAGKFWPMLEDEVIRDIVKVSLDGGINWFDTAELYGGGASERELSMSLADLGVQPGTVTIATKWWPILRTASNIRKTIDDRLKALSPFPVDLYQVHNPFGFSPVGKEMDAMAGLVSAKKIRYIGVSNYSAKQMRTAWETLNKKGITLVSNQVRYNLLDRKIETNGIMDTAKELGITIIAYSPLAQGLITGKFHDNPELVRNTGYRQYTGPFRKNNLEKSRPLIDLIKSFAGKSGATTSQVALSWLINFHGDTVVAIPGATSALQAKQNSEAMKLSLSAEDMEQLNEASGMFR
jgi:aryl-alcohol dehydrogenase-like predicted oxidoreductase